MKPISFSFFVALMALISCKKEEPAVTDCLPSHLNNGLIASYSFAGGTLDNGEGSAGNLTNNNGASMSTDRNGNSNCAYYFDASKDQFLSSASTNFLNGLNAFSVSLWYQPMDSSRTGGQYEVLVGRNSVSVHCPDRRGEWSVGLYDCRRAVFGHNNSVWIDEPAGLPPASCEDLINEFTGTWQHVVAVYDNDTYKIYYNGVLHTTDTGAADCTNNYLAQDIGDLFLGKLYTGKLDDILIYNRALTDQDVADLYAEDTCCEA